MKCIICYAEYKKQKDGKWLAKHTKTCIYKGRLA